MSESDRTKDEMAGKGGEGKKVDQGWKEEARKAREARKETGGTGGAGRQRVGPMKADFSFLVNGLAMQVLMSLGNIPSPVTGEAGVNLEQAKHGIDMLDMLLEKTKGNLSEEESKLLSTTLYDLRVRYIALSRPGTL